MGIEIERKFTIKELPKDLEKYNKHIITQAYLCNDPTVRIRRQDDEYYMTYKQKGLMAHTEYNLPLTEEGYEHLLTKADGNVISKTRYLIPISNPQFDMNMIDNEKKENVELVVELDIFDEPFKPLIIAEVEFPDEETANAYIPEDWFEKDVTDDRRYYNSNLVYKRFPD